MTRPRTIPLLLVALLLLSSLAPLASAGEAWTKETGSAITAVATDERGDLIFVGTESGMLYCYNSAGSVVWSVQLAPAGAARPSILDIRADTEGHIWVWRPNVFYLRDAETGADIWSQGDPTISAEGGDLSNTGIALNVWSNVFDLKDPSTGQTIYRSSGSYNNGAISGDGTWVVVTKQADPNLYLYSVNPPPDDWIAPSGGFGWQNRVSHTIAGSTDGALTNYPVEITIIRGTGTTSGSTLYAPDCRADFADIRFTAADGVTQIPYYLESVVGNTATFRVQIPAIPASPGTTTIYVYWANPAATTTTSDPAAADYPVEILLYDDFNDGVIDGNWTVSLTNPTHGTATEAGGYLELRSQPSFVGALGKVTVTGPNHNTPIRIEVQANTVPTIYGTERVRLFSPGAEYPMISKDPGHTTYQLYLSDWTGIAATVGSYITHNIYINATHTRWVAGSDWDITTPNGATPMQATFITGDMEWPYLPSSVAVHGTLRLDEITVYRWVGPGSGVEPTHGAWGPVESIVTPLDTKTLDGTIIDIDAPETGDWVAVSTTTKTYIIEITDSGFGTVYSADRTGTPYDVAIANNGANTIEGRGILADIFRFDGAQTGTYTAGGPVRTVAIAQKNGLYAAAGSDDGKYYIFSKDESSSWYLLHASDSEDLVTAIAMSWRGEIAVIGRADGSVIAFRVTEEELAGSIRVTVFKDNIPYRDATIYVERSDGNGEFGPRVPYITDSYGAAVIPVQWGSYYRITAGETKTTLAVTPLKTEHVIVIPSELPVRLHLDYSTGYDPATRDIWIRYVDDEAKTNAVTFRLYRTADNALEYEETFSPIPAEGLFTNHTISWTNSSYRVQMSAVRDGQTITNTWHQWVGADVAALPGELDDGIRLGIWFIVILFVAGLFSYLTGPQGAVVTSLLAAFLVLIGWLPLEPAVVALCVVWAFLGLLGRTSAER